MGEPKFNQLQFSTAKQLMARPTGLEPVTYGLEGDYMACTFSSNVAMKT